MAFLKAPANLPFRLLLPRLDPPLLEPPAIEPERDLPSFSPLKTFTLVELADMLSVSSLVRKKGGTQISLSLVDGSFLIPGEVTAPKLVVSAF